MSRYEAVARVLWEIPFPLRLPPRDFLCWEPNEGVALFHPRLEVGDLDWHRKSRLLKPNELFREVGPPNDFYPDHHYLITEQIGPGREINIANLTSGPDGGFTEVRPYLLANIFLCLRLRSEFNDAAVIQRAGRAMNNILDAYRFVELDPLVRSVRPDRDSYYTLVSVADVPAEHRALDARELLRMVSSLSFGKTIGLNLKHHVGLNSFDALLAGDILPSVAVSQIAGLIEVEQHLELFHHLLFSAIRRLKLKEHSLAVLDAQSAFEAFVARLIVENLEAQGSAPEFIETQMGVGGALHFLQSRLRELDRMAASNSSGSSSPHFLASPEETNWRTRLYGLRNRIVHAGLREVPFSDAKLAVVAGMHAIYAIRNLAPSFRRGLFWPKGALDLGHVAPSAGRLSRLFEA